MKTKKLLTHVQFCHCQRGRKRFWTVSPKPKTITLTFLCVIYDRVGESVDLALSALAAIFRLLVRSLTIFDKKYHILTRRDKRESYLIVLQQNNV